MAAPPQGYDGDKSVSPGGMSLKSDQLSLLVTVVLAFSALAALVLTGQAGIREDMRALGAAMLAGQSELRAEMRAGQAELRKEMRAGQAELRAEMRAGQAELRAGQEALRKEMQAGQEELRREMRAGQAEIRADLAVLGTRLAIVEHRTDTLESLLAVTEPPASEPCEGTDCPGS